MCCGKTKKASRPTKGRSRLKRNKSVIFNMKPPEGSDNGKKEGSKPENEKVPTDA